MPLYFQKVFLSMIFTILMIILRYISQTEAGLSQMSNQIVSEMQFSKSFIIDTPGLILPVAFWKI